MQFVSAPCVSLGYKDPEPLLWFISFILQEYDLRASAVGLYNESGNGNQLRKGRFQW